MTMKCGYHALITFAVTILCPDTCKFSTLILSVFLVTQASFHKHEFDVGNVLCGLEKYAVVLICFHFHYTNIQVTSVHKSTYYFSTQKQRPGSLISVLPNQTAKICKSSWKRTKYTLETYFTVIQPQTWHISSHRKFLLVGLIIRFWTKYLFSVTQII